MAGKHGVASAMSVKYHAHFGFDEGVEGAPTNGKNIDHYVFAAHFFDVLGAFKHFIEFSGNVGHVDFFVAGKVFGFVSFCKSGAHAFLEVVKAHGGEVFVVFNNVEAAGPGIVGDLGVLSFTEADFWFYNGTDEGAFFNFSKFADALNAELGAGEAIDDSFGEFDVEESEAANRFHAENVAGNGGKNGAHVVLFEKFDRVGNVDFLFFGVEFVDGGFESFGNGGIHGGDVSPGADGGFEGAVFGGFGEAVAFGWNDFESTDKIVWLGAILEVEVVERFHRFGVRGYRGENGKIYVNG